VISRSYQCTDCVKHLLTLSPVAANSTTVAPAAVEVSPNSSVNYFSFESTQLTNEVISNLTALNLTGIEYFNFGNASSTVAKRDSASCKVLPGDAAWPSEIEWFLLDLLLGGALIEGIPTAAPCYSNWPQYNADECTAITSEWETSEFQYFPLPSYLPYSFSSLTATKDHLNPPVWTGHSLRA
jgi:hypothetical protein